MSTPRQTKVTQPLILAGGKGTRLQHELPKPMVPLLGKPMLSYVIQACKDADFLDPVISLGHRAELVQEILPATMKRVVSPVQRGTAKAVEICKPLIHTSADYVLIVFADSPLWTKETLQWLVERHTTSDAVLSIGTVTGHREYFDDRARITRGTNQEPLGIKKIKECSAEDLLIDEYNADIFCCNSDWLWTSLELITSENSYAEYNLSDIIAISLAQNKKIQALPLPFWEETLGINTPDQLMRAEEVLSHRIHA